MWSFVCFSCRVVCCVVLVVCVTCFSSYTGNIQVGREDTDQTSAAPHT